MPSALLAAGCVLLIWAAAGRAAPAQTCVPLITGAPCSGLPTAQLPTAKLPTAQPDDGVGEAALLVQVTPGFTPGRLDPLLATLGASLERSLWQIRVLSLRVPSGSLEHAVRLLQGHPDVVAVEPEGVVSALEANPNDSHWPGQWGLRRAGFPSAWSTTRGSAETVVAVVDTGVEATHPDLRTALLAGRDFVDEDQAPLDEHGHGTAVAGVLAARTNNRAGIAGVCWNCRVLPVRVLDRAGRGDSATLAAGIIWAANHGADVINLSLGGEARTMAEDRALAYAARRGVVIVAAAGNDGSRRKQFPAADEHVISVTATDPSDRLYAWSNRGDWVDVAAPGCNTSPWRGGSYATFCGTSSATPLVAGLAALIRSVRPRATADEITDAVLRSTSRASGRLDASLAFPVALPKRPTFPSDTPLQDAVIQFIHTRQ